MLQFQALISQGGPVGQKVAPEHLQIPGLSHIHVKGFPEEVGERRLVRGNAAGNTADHIRDNNRSRSWMSRPTTPLPNEEDLEGALVDLVQGYDGLTGLGHFEPEDSLDVILAPG